MTYRGYTITVTRVPAGWRATAACGARRLTTGVHASEAWAVKVAKRLVREQGN